MPGGVRRPRRRSSCRRVARWHDPLPGAATTTRPAIFGSYSRAAATTLTGASLDLREPRPGERRRSPRHRREGPGSTGSHREERQLRLDPLVSGTCRDPWRTSAAFGLHPDHRDLDLASADGSAGSRSRGNAGNGKRRKEPAGNTTVRSAPCSSLACRTSVVTARWAMSAVDLVAPARYRDELRVCVCSRGRASPTSIETTMRPGVPLITSTRSAR